MNQLNWILRPFATAALGTLATLAGCGQTTAPSNKPTAAPDEATQATVPIAAQDSDPAAASELSLQVVTWEEAKKVIASHQGKVVVVDFWSTYCPPCLKELPGLAKLQEEHRDEVVALTLNCNYTGVDAPEDERPAILAALTEAKLTGKHLICGDEDQTLYRTIGIASVPVVQVYDRTGALRKQFDNERDEYGEAGFTYAEHIAPFVKSLLQEHQPVAEAK
jgi:thiol-disulfide isomerase/thioredoxin